MTRWQLHVAEWKDCRRCNLHRGRKQVVLARGQIPCDVLFVGEAPGESEDVIGRPFVGPAGKLLDSIVESAFRREFCGDCLKLGELVRTVSVKTEDQDGWTCTARFHDGCDMVRPRIAFTNLVGCVPRDEDGGKATEPDDDYVVACSDRVIDLVSMARPKLIVRVGKLANYWLDPQMKRSIKFGEVPFVDVVHPAAILRANVAQQGLMIQRCVVTLKTAIEEL